MITADITTLCVFTDYTDL